MGKRAKSISKRQWEFIENQKMFFVGTATEEGRVNVSPKGMDTLKVIDPGRVIWLNLTGSGNETAAHVLHSGRMTIMFCAFEGNPMILRLYGQAKVYHERDIRYQEFINMFPEHYGARQIFELEVDLVQNSCGFGVPLYSYVGQRTLLEEWSLKKGDEGLQEYWKEKNIKSLDELDTGIFGD